jgi:hypothetical protein
LLETNTRNSKTCRPLYWYGAFLPAETMEPLPGLGFRLTILSYHQCVNTKKRLATGLDNSYTCRSRRKILVVLQRLSAVGEFNRWTGKLTLNEFNEVEMRLGTEPKYPKVVKIAGIIWIVFGCLNLLSVSAFVFLLVTGLADYAVGRMFGSLLVSAAFIYVGQQSIRGTAHSTVGNGIGSVLWGSFNLIVGGLQAVPGQIIGVGISFLGGVALIAAGILALVGRNDYKAWHRVQKSRRETQS